MPGRTAVPVVALSTSPRERSEDDLNNLGNLGYLQRERENSPGSPNNLRKQIAEHLLHFGLLEDGPLPSIDETGQIMKNYPQRANNRQEPSPLAVSPRSQKGSQCSRL